MALFGGFRDINTFKNISTELLQDVISQNCGYYKLILAENKPNIYGEVQNKTYIGPVLLNCLIERGDFTAKKEDFGIQIDRIMTFRFLKEHMVIANVVPEVGDVIMYNENYYNVDNVNENQMIVGKDDEYAYEDGLENYGNSYSIILQAHLTSPEIIGLSRNRI